MGDISSYYKDLQQKVWDYTSSAAHDRNAKKVESKRMELINSVKSGTETVSKLTAFEGDDNYRQAVLEFLSIYETILVQDYARIVDMEEIAEQSYDLMETYMKAQEVANKKLDDASELMSQAQKDFGAKHNITITEDESDLSKKMNIANQVNQYNNNLYLIFFKSHKQELYLMNAVLTGDVNAIEQNKTALIQTSQEGLDITSKMEGYKKDKSVLEVTNELLTYYNKEAKEKIQNITDFYVAKEKFEKINAGFEKIKEKDRTKEDVDKYNEASQAYNETVSVFNDTSNEITQAKNELLDEYNKTVKKFLGKHISK
jgi:hypothetical protein